MRVVDVSAPLRDGMPVWPGDPPFQRVERKSLDRGDANTVSDLSLGAHTGTHIDAPSHFIRGGGGIGSIPLDVLVGPAVVVSLEEVRRAIGAEDLERAGIPDGTTRMLAKTRNSGWSRTDTEFREDFVTYDASAAGWCVERGIRLLGIDYLSIEPYGEEREGYPVHRTLLGAGVVIVEGLDLAGVAPGPYTVMALPLSIPESEGAPARAVLIED